MQNQTTNWSSWKPGEERTLTHFHDECAEERFTELEKLGDTYLGKVLVVRDNRDSRIKAIRVYDHLRAIETEKLNQCAKYFEKCKNLNPKFVAKHFEITTFKNKFAVLVEFVQGENLTSKLRKAKDKPAEFHEIKRIVLQLGEIFKEVKRSGIFLREFDPDSIVFDEENNLKLVDLDFRPLIETDSSVNYSSNELKLKCEYWIFRQDEESMLVYKLGIVILELMCGEKLLDNYKNGSREKFQEVGPKRKRFFGMTIPKKFKKYKSFLEIVTSPNPKIRPRTIDELLQKFEHGVATKEVIRSQVLNLFYPLNKYL